MFGRETRARVNIVGVVPFGGEAHNTNLRFQLGNNKNKKIMEIDLPSDKVLYALRDLLFYPTGGEVSIAEDNQGRLSFPNAYGGELSECR